APTIIIFGFKRSAEDAPHDERNILEVLRRAASSAKQHGLTLAVENEPGFWCDTGTNTARMLAQIDLPNLRANWDPCNAIGTKEIPYPQGYEAIKKWIVNVHVKDTSKGATVSCVPIGAGKVDWRGQLQALVRDRVVAHVTIETHCLPLLENSRKNLETLRGLLAAAETF
ncbi:sugar phosphate isomerase/epimerase, partial [candidate division KSB1 bacterium]|nr:sugar phosphate isomerase/epimerase [candidate division KSB1 bacterium]